MKLLGRSRLSLFVVGSAVLGPGVQADTIVPVVTQDPLVKGGQTIHVVDPWIRPPRGNTAQYAVDVPGDFEGYPSLEAASPLDRITFYHRTIGRTQRHGVYVITNQTLVQDYLNGTTDTPCGPNLYTPDAVCQVASDTGLNGTNCPNRVTLFPLMEIFGSTGAVVYTTPELGYLADMYGYDDGQGKQVWRLTVRGFKDGQTHPTQKDERVTASVACT